MLNNEEEEIHNPVMNKNLELADIVVEQAKENLKNVKWNIVDRCGFPVEKVERMFGSAAVKLFTHSKAHNTWAHFVYEKRKEFADVSKSQHNDKEKTTCVNKEVARAYNPVNADKNKFKALEDRTKFIIRQTGCLNIDPDFTQNVQCVKELTGSESLVIFGAPQYRSNIGVQLLDEMNAKSSSDSNFYALQDRFDHCPNP
ncbi:hypothetical protein INT45_012469 [Circinella minor]|uniref:Uncharacterized protein n=1 Tax=Circinella minor TaxID=1195481 RepID=A0A8H7S232_9FUNG|nr:hypothetical protein INT45_012469 [Circinella minor]